MKLIGLLTHPLLLDKVNYPKLCWGIYVLSHQEVISTVLTQPVRSVGWKAGHRVTDTLA